MSQLFVRLWGVDAYCSCNIIRDYNKGVLYKNRLLEKIVKINIQCDLRTPDYTVYNDYISDGMPGTSEVFLAPHGRTKHLEGCVQVVACVYGMLSRPKGIVVSEVIWIDR